MLGKLNWCSTKMQKRFSWFGRSIQANGNYAIAHFALGVALAQIGLSDEARSAAMAGLAINPSLQSTACSMFHKAMIRPSSLPESARVMRYG
jgi:hypothetical protein